MNTQGESQISEGERAKLAVEASSQGLNSIFGYINGNQEGFVEIDLESCVVSKDLTCCSWASDAGRTRRVSSAYWMTGKSGHEMEARGVSIKPACIASLHMDCRRSAANTNSKGESGSPCLTPHL